MNSRVNVEFTSKSAEFTSKPREFMSKSAEFTSGQRQFIQKTIECNT
ncbi:hypothetical protein [Peribacillus frigoritolerans]|nr:hypothetical protein [Peribacillus frigoritolerans]MED3845112.1 hypothetical protein [Peribacillus frigoritolerans]